MDIQEQLNLLSSIKANLKFKLMEKGVSIDDNTPFSHYPNFIDEIKSNEQPSCIKEKIFMSVIDGNLGSKLLQEKVSKMASDNLINSKSIKVKIYKTAHDSFTNSTQIQDKISDSISDGFNYEQYIGWEIIGNLIRNNDYYYNFSDTNYLINTVDSVISSTDEITFVLHIKTNDDVITQQSLLGTFENDNAFFVGIKNGQWCFVDKQDGIEESACTVTGDIVETNTEYYIKIVFSSDGTTILKYSKDDTLYTSICTINRTQDLNVIIGKGFSQDSTWYGFKGIIFNPSLNTIPPNYSRVEYIENTSNAAINTNYYPNANTDAEINFTRTTTETNNSLFGVQDFSSKRFSIYFTPNISFRFTNNNDSTKPYFLIEDGTLRNDSLLNSNGIKLGLLNTYIKINKNIIKIMNSDINQVWDMSEQENWGNIIDDISMPLYLFCMYSGGTMSYHEKAKIYSFKIKENNILKLNLIPCKRKSDGIYGMYDTVSKTFKTSTNPNCAFIGG